MGRILKRVPLDFIWPKDMVWKGYLNPYAYHECKACKGQGQNRETTRIVNNFYNHSSETGIGWHDQITQDEVDALICHNRLMDFTHDWSSESGWQPKDPMPVVTAEEVNRWERSRRGIGHDSCNRWILIETRAKRLGVYGKCPVCEGTGSLFCSPEFEKLQNEWTKIEPPTGEGYQLWETTSEGSPISPVFSTLDDLCAWAETNAGTFGSFKTTKENWKSMLEEDCVVHKEGNKIFM